MNYKFHEKGTLYNAIIFKKKYMESWCNKFIKILKINGIRPVEQNKSALLTINCQYGKVTLGVVKCLIGRGHRGLEQTYSLLYWIKIVLRLNSLLQNYVISLGFKSLTQRDANILVFS
jgi:hypothetical protein